MYGRSDSFRSTGSRGGRSSSSRLSYRSSASSYDPDIHDSEHGRLHRKTSGVSSVGSFGSGRLDLPPRGPYGGGDDSVGGSSRRSGRSRSSRTSNGGHGGAGGYVPDAYDDAPRTPRPSPPGGKSFSYSPRPPPPTNPRGGVE